MKKTFIMVLASLALSLSVHAVRPVHVAFPVKQADGTTVLLYKNGDGHLAFYTTLDNQVVVRNGEGMLCYAKLENGQLVPIVRSRFASKSVAALLIALFAASRSLSLSFSCSAFVCKNCSMFRFA